MVEIPENAPDIVKKMMKKAISSGKRKVKPRSTSQPSKPSTPPSTSPKSSPSISSKPTTPQRQPSPDEKIPLTLNIKIRDEKGKMVSFTSEEQAHEYLATHPNAKLVDAYYAGGVGKETVIIPAERITEVGLRTRETLIGGNTVFVKVKELQKAKQLGMSVKEHMRLTKEGYRKVEGFNPYYVKAQQVMNIPKDKDIRSTFYAQMREAMKQAVAQSRKVMDYEAKKEEIIQQLNQLQSNTNNAEAKRTIEEMKKAVREGDINKYEKLKQEYENTLTTNIEQQEAKLKQLMQEGTEEEKALAKQMLNALQNNNIAEYNRLVNKLYMLNEKKLEQTKQDLLKNLKQNEESLRKAGVNIQFWKKRIENTPLNPEEMQRLIEEYNMELEKANRNLKILSSFQNLASIPAKLKWIEQNKAFIKAAGYNSKKLAKKVIMGKDISKEVKDIEAYMKKYKQAAEKMKQKFAATLFANEISKKVGDLVYAAEFVSPYSFNIDNKAINEARKTIAEIKAGIAETAVGTPLGLIGVGIDIAKEAITNPVGSIKGLFNIPEQVRSIKNIEEGKPPTTEITAPGIAFYTLQSTIETSLADIVGLALPTHNGKTTWEAYKTPREKTSAALGIIGTVALLPSIGKVGKVGVKTFGKMLRRNKSKPEIAEDIMHLAKAVKEQPLESFTISKPKDATIERVYIQKHKLREIEAVKNPLELKQKVENAKLSIKEARRIEKELEDVIHFVEGRKKEVKLTINDKQLMENLKQYSKVKTQAEKEAIKKKIKQRVEELMPTEIKIQRERRIVGGTSIPNPINAFKHGGIKALSKSIQRKLTPKQTGEIRNVLVGDYIFSTHIKRGKVVEFGKDKIIERKRFNIFPSTANYIEYSSLPRTVGLVAKTEKGNVGFAEGVGYRVKGREAFYLIRQEGKKVEVKIKGLKLNPNLLREFGGFWEFKQKGKGVEKQFKFDMLLQQGRLSEKAANYPTLESPITFKPSSFTLKPVVKKKSKIGINDKFEFFTGRGVSNGKPFDIGIAKNKDYTLLQVGEGFNSLVAKIKSYPEIEKPGREIKIEYAKPPGRPFVFSKTTPKQEAKLSTPTLKQEAKLPTPRQPKAIAIQKTKQKTKTLTKQKALTKQLRVLEKYQYEAIPIVKAKEKTKTKAITIPKVLTKTKAITKVKVLTLAKPRFKTPTKLRLSRFSWETMQQTKGFRISTIEKIQDWEPIPIIKISTTKSPPPSGGGSRFPSFNFNYDPIKPIKPDQEQPRIVFPTGSGGGLPSLWFGSRTVFGKAKASKVKVGNVFSIL